MIPLTTGRLHISEPLTLTPSIEYSNAVLPGGRTTGVSVFGAGETVVTADVLFVVKKLAEEAGLKVQVAEPVGRVKNAIGQLT